MEKFFEIGNRKVGKDFPPLIIAEIGINHNGSLKTAKEMVNSAARAGVEVIKHQTHIIEDEMCIAAKKTIPGNAKESIYDIMKKCALSEEDEKELQRYVIERGMIFISTPFSRKAADRLHDMQVPACKIGSGECNNYPLIKHIANFKKPIILSTGMNNLATISKAVDILEAAGVQYALMHTTSLYPTPYEKIRLGALAQLEENFSNAVIGLSDHSSSNHPCLGAVALGASILERHFTDAKHREGPDIKISMDENECKELIRDAKIMFECRGGGKNILPEERVTINFAYASVVVNQTRGIKKGELITEENIWVKRPGTGEIPAEKYEEIINGDYRARKNMKYDHQLRWNDMEKSTRASDFKREDNKFTQTAPS